MSKRVWLGLAPVLVLGLVACGGGFTSSGDPLSGTEANDLAAALVEGGAAGLGGFGAAAPSRAPGAVATTISQAIHDTIPCTGGDLALDGNASVTGSQGSSTITVGFDYTVAHHGCQLPAGGKTFTINGDPNIKAQGDFTLTSGTTSSSFNGSLSYGGKFDWTSSDSRAGVCGVDLTANYDFTFGGTTTTGSATLTGSVCGVSVNRQITVTP